MIDTHTHLNFEAFKNDWREVVDRAMQNGVQKMVVVGTDLTTSERAVEMTSHHLALYAAVGIHPHHAKSLVGSEFLGVSMGEHIGQLEKLITEPKVVAVGEIGLDDHVYSASTKYKAEPNSPKLMEIQKKLFRAQLELAHKYNKPVIVHSRKVKRDALDELMAFNQSRSSRLNGVFHCFEGSKQFAREILAQGFYLSFTGNLTFEQGKGEVAKLVPLNKLLLETDCPYMTPEPERGQKRQIDEVLRSEPRHVKIIGQFHADCRGIPADQVFSETDKNVKRLFGI